MIRSPAEAAAVREQKGKGRSSHREPHQSTRCFCGGFHPLLGLWRTRLQLKNKAIIIDPTRSGPSIETNAHPISLLIFNSCSMKNTCLLPHVSSSFFLVRGKLGEKNTARRCSWDVQASIRPHLPHDLSRKLNEASPCRLN